MLMPNYIIYGKVLTVHGSSDKIISVQSAYEFAKIIPNHMHTVIIKTCYPQLL